ncbi:MAG: 50S ribosomal protein L15 [Patescibacteria group bacterium]|nr:50S ribosomal protein L15 [Patescibacteria group bacterium]
MSIAMHTLKPAKGSTTRKFRIGRGNASGRGTTAGRGTKGQRARAGGRNKLKLKGMRQMLLSFPKNRGFRSLYVKAEVVSLERLGKTFKKPETITLALLKKSGLVNKQALSAKIVGKGEIKLAFKLQGVTATKAATEAIEKAGGKVN